MVKILQPFETSWLDYPDNESLAVMVCFMGCDNGCKGCQNIQFQNPDYSIQTKEFSVVELKKRLLEVCQKNRTNKVVFSGGDSLSCFNIEFTKELLKDLDLDVCIYTGHNIEYVKEHNVKGFKFVKCGRFDVENKRESYKTDEEMVFASPNQALYNENYECLSENGILKF